jgi:hypothetical protein
MNTFTGSAADVEDLIENSKDFKSGRYYLHRNNSIKFDSRVDAKFNSWEDGYLDHKYDEWWLHQDEEYQEEDEDDYLEELNVLEER